MKQAKFYVIGLAITAIQFIEFASSKTAIPDTDTPLVRMSEYKPPAVPDGAGYYYPDNFRILDCWQCFQAHGKICHDEDYGPANQHVGSGNKYNSFCCKPDYNQGYCENGKKHTNIPGQDITTVCSPKSMDDPAGKSKFNNVLSSDGRNHQMFAFCPAINQRTCGISADEKTDMRLKAGLKRDLVYSKDMRYRKGNETYREADACYYEISLSDELTSEQLKNLTEEKNGGDVIIKINVTKMDEMNVYIYGGRSKSTAFESVTQNNDQVALGNVYNISAYRGFVVVAYPNEDKDTEFAFNYWADVTRVEEEEKELPPAQWWEFEGKTGEAVFTTLVSTAMGLMSIVCLLCIYNCVLKCKMRSLQKAKKTEDEENELMTIEEQNNPELELNAQTAQNEANKYQNVQNNESMDHMQSMGNDAAPVNVDRQMSLNVNVANTATRPGPIAGQDPSARQEYNTQAQ